MDLEKFMLMLKDRKFDEADEAEAQGMIEFLDEVHSRTKLKIAISSTCFQSISKLSSDSNIYARAVRRLQLLCREVGRLPSSCLLSTKVVLEVPEPYSRSAFSDVYRGRLGTVPVALKVLRVHIDSKTKVEKTSNH